MSHDGIRRGRMTNDERAEIERLAVKMKKPTASKIARLINRHPATVKWYMLTHGLIEHAPRRAPRPYVRFGKTIHPYAEEHDELLLDMRNAGLPHSEIAVAVTRKFGIERSAHSVHVRIVQLAAGPGA